MPELPEVQTTIDGIVKADVIGKKISNFLLDYPKMIAPLSAAAFKDIIIDNSPQKIFRKGKYIFFKLLNNWHLVVHLRMSGKFIKTDTFSLEKHEHAAFNFSNGVVLKFHDPRKFGTITLTQDVSKILARIGIDALDFAFTATWLEEHISSKKKALKALLLDQSFIAGIGNIYADEILFASKLHPQTIANSLDRKKIKDLHQSIQNILNEAIRNKGTSLGGGLSNFKSFKDQGKYQNYLAVYGKNNQLCKRCGSEIIKQVLFQRGTYTCPKCQPLRENTLNSQTH